MTWFTPGKYYQTTKAVELPESVLEVDSKNFKDNVSEYIDRSKKEFVRVVYEGKLRMTIMTPSVDLDKKDPQTFEKGSVLKCVELRRSDNTLYAILEDDDTYYAYQISMRQESHPFIEMMK